MHLRRVGSEFGGELDHLLGVVVAELHAEGARPGAGDREEVGPSRLSGVEHGERDGRVALFFERTGIRQRPRGVARSLLEREPECFDRRSHRPRNRRRLRAMPGGHGDRRGNVATRRMLSHCRPWIDLCTNRVDRRCLARRRRDPVDPLGDELRLFKLAVVVRPLPAHRRLAHRDDHDLVVGAVNLHGQHGDTLEHAERELLGVRRGAGLGAV